MSDTTAEAANIQTEVLRGLTGVERLLIALDMSCTVRELARARLRTRYPEWDERRLSREFFRLVSAELPPLLR